MNIETIQVPPEEAAAKVAEYERLIAAERNAEDQAILAAYRAAARGLPVISMAKTIAVGGFFANGLPRLAVVRATAGECLVQWSGWGEGTSVIFYDADPGWDGRRRNRGALVGKHSVRVPVEDPPAARCSSSASTIVPVIPPDVRPRLRRLAGFHILWEVEEWKPVPPVDPALIRHIRGDLWALQAVWNLTDLERLVLSQ